jgi:hypothetical protein
LHTVYICNLKIYPLEELISLNPLYSGLNLSQEQIQAHLAIERRNYQDKMEKARMVQDAELQRTLKKKNLEQIANQMESQYLQEQSRRQQYAQELAILQQKYKTNQEPVMFA